MLNWENLHKDKLFIITNHPLTAFHSISLIFYHFPPVQLNNMYQEEYSPYDNVFDDDNDKVSISISSMDDSILLNNKINNKLRKYNDPGFKKYKLLLITSPTHQEEENNKNPKKKQKPPSTLVYSVENYCTPNIQGAHIRHAESGIYTQHRVGSSDDDFYFSVVDVLGTSSRKLYYNNPEEYEIHFKNVLPLSVKNAWYERIMAKKMKSDKTK